MKKVKRILALFGILFLVAMYICTIIFAFTDHTRSMGLLKASIACTIFVPVLLYAITLFSRLFRHENDDNDPPSF